jgi:DNA-binding NarL/FixJ family response regulator
LQGGSWSRTRGCDPRRVSIGERDPDARSVGSVLTVDDQAFFRGALRELVTSTHTLVFAGEAESGERAVEMVRQLQPDLVLIDVRMPGLGGIAAARSIKAVRSATVVVLVSTAQRHELAPEVEECCADEIVWKSDLRPELLDDIWRRHSHDVRRTAPTE